MKRTISPFLLLLVLFFLPACGMNPNDRAAGSETGDLAFQLSWGHSAPAGAQPAPAAGEDICTFYKIGSVSITVMNSSGQTVASVNWPCSAHGGTISNVPVGTVNVTVDCLVGGVVLWRGQATGVTILAGRTANAGTVAMNYVGSDITAPTVSSPTPANNATGVAVNTTASVVFSEDVATPSVNANTFTLTCGATSVPGTVTYDSPTWKATFTPTTPLPAASTCTATITTGVEDLAGLPIAANYQWDFTTGAAGDMAAPAVQSVNPANGASGVSLNSTVRAAFSEDVITASVNNNTFTLTCGTATVSGTVAYDSPTWTATFTAGTLLPASSTCSATITTGVKDLTGNPMAAFYQWSFTTSSAVARFAYVADNTEGTVSTYIVDATTGRLKYIDKVEAGPYPYSVTVDPSGRYAYVATNPDFGNTTVSQFTIGTNGKLTPMNPATVTAGRGPVSVAIDPSGKYAYIANNWENTISQFTIGTDGSLTPMNPATVTTQEWLIDITVDPSGRYVYAVSPGELDNGEVNQYTIGADGTLTAMTFPYLQAGMNPTSITVHPSGEYAYVVDPPSDSVLQNTISTTTGGLIPMSPATVATGATPYSLAIDPSGRYAYVANIYGNSISQYMINEDGSLTALLFDVATETQPRSITVDPSGKYAYVANQGGNSVSQYTIGTNGYLTPMSPATVPGQSGPSFITLSRGGTAAVPVPIYAYVLNGSGNNVSQYTIGTDGSLTAMSPATVASGTQPRSITVDPSGKYAYVTNMTDDDVSQYTIGTDGSLTAMNPASVAAGDGSFTVVVHPSGKYAYVANTYGNNVSQYTIGADGSLTAMSPATVAAGSQPHLITIDPSGKYAYVSNLNNSVSQYSIGADGSLTAMSPATVATGSYPYSVTVDPSGRYAYVANSGSDNVSQYTIGANGSLTPMMTATVAAGDGSFSVFVHPSGKYAYVANSYSNNVSQYTIGANGYLTPMSPATVAAGTEPRFVIVDPSGEYAYVGNSGSNSISQYTIGADGSLTAMSPATVAAGSWPYSAAIVATYQ